VVEEGKPRFAGDLWELIQKVEEIGERVRAVTGVGFPSRWPVI